MPEIVSKYVEVCVYRNTGTDIEYLILKRAAGVVLPNIWQIVTGRIEKDEKAYEAAYREFKEETSLSPERFLIGPDVTAFYNHESDTMNVIPVFIAEVSKGEVTLCKEHCEYEWANYDKAFKELYWFDQKENLRKINICLTDKNLYKTLVQIKI